MAAKRSPHTKTTKPRGKAMTFRSTLLAGHKGVTAFLVPFDPAATWGLQPIPLDDRREGWLVAGQLQGVPFAGWIGYRWGRFFVIVEDKLLAATASAVGDECSVRLRPSTSPKALQTAREQAPSTTAARRRISKRKA